MYVLFFNMLLILTIYLKNEELPDSPLDDNSPFILDSPSTPHPRAGSITPSPCTSINASQSASTLKPKAYVDSIADVARNEQAVRLKMLEQTSTHNLNIAQEKTQWALALERIRLEHQAAESEKLHQHELLMLEKQIELERLRRGI